MKKRLKKLTPLMSDKEAEEFVDKADLSEYDLSGFKPFRFELQKKDKVLHMRLPLDLADAIKAQAREHGMPYQRYVRHLLEAAVNKAA
ncbi:MAG: hypothetical protein DU429_07995 [Candidatus Tokpelaia sp.]|uniref:CopG family antitoxin n=1 Tax=Candidatus Tokpelaia sp. TaxID=2233777 RepID=UPI00123A4A6E|nr:CopG family antitoxin [Candidatus Tokpelaia sp.]KAA6205463.1 MAG: hypothetical protein DU429_07995 [Candidatus Tokpelaia sp.]KAA6206080.1 MAG: hypothetical protein DU430_02270 [Candidatus Tokpelaia sp.]KAA6405641.1 hypothetical protein DPQ22_03785 [Candidatus Tokpelaia sp.]